MWDICNYSLSGAVYGSMWETVTRIQNPPKRFRPPRSDLISRELFSGVRRPSISAQGTSPPAPRLARSFFRKEKKGGKSRNAGPASQCCGVGGFTLPSFFFSFFLNSRTHLFGPTWRHSVPKLTHAQPKFVSGNFCDRKKKKERCIVL